jgi:hypothetical protein
MLWIIKNIFFYLNNVDNSILLLITYPQLFFLVNSIFSMTVSVINKFTAPTTITTKNLYIYSIYMNNLQCGLLRRSKYENNM